MRNGRTRAWAVNQAAIEMANILIYFLAVIFLQEKSLTEIFNRNP